MWLEFIGVVSGCCCKEVYRFPQNNYYLGHHSLTPCFLSQKEVLVHVGGRLLLFIIPIK